MSADPRERLESLGRTAAELLHDLSADLQMLRGWARLVAEGVRTGRASEPDSAALEEEAQRVGTLVADLVGWVADPRAHGAFSPAMRLRAVVERVDRREGVVPMELRTADAEAWRVSGPPTFFDRIAANLLRNAVRYAARRVRVTLVPEVRGGADGVRLRVEDDGSGIEASLRGRLFTPFAHAGEEGGHGLGLSSTAWLVEQLGGLPPQALDSSLGGAALEVWLPGQLQVEEPRPSGSVAGLEVVVVDDDPGVRAVLVAMLQREGAAAQGLDYAPDLVARLTALQPGLLLLDQHLGPVTGLEIWEALRVRDPALAARTALLTGAAAKREAGRAPPVLSKPLDLEALRRVAGALPRRPRRMAAAAALRERPAVPVPAQTQAAVLREVLRALDSRELGSALAGLHGWSAAAGDLPARTRTELDRAAREAREALGQGKVSAAREWVARGLVLIENPDEC